MITARYIIGVGLLTSLSGNIFAAQPIRVGSKKFTESVILAEIATTMIGQLGEEALHVRELGGTRILWNALLGGDLDVYPDYTGTIIQELLSETKPMDIPTLRRRLAEMGIGVSESLGFSNTYAISMQRQLAQDRHIRTMSDLRSHPNLAFGFSNEFMARRDGWPGLKEAYQLPQRNVTGLDHDLAYRGLQSGHIQVTDCYSTDAEIQYYDLTALEDDRHFFPDYQAVFLWRLALGEERPDFLEAIRKLEGQISSDTMVRLNARSKLDKAPARKVAVEFVNEHFGYQIVGPKASPWSALKRNSIEHLRLVGISLVLAIIAAVPLGVLAAKFPRLGKGVLAGVGILQTIPSLALLVFMIPLLGIGALPAMAALFLYSLLPIVTNTHQGLTDIPARTIESARVIGLPASAILWKIELPLALGSILAGIKTSAVINIGTATLGALVGAGGYGQPILTGIRLDDFALILSGAVPAAALAVAAQFFFWIMERAMIPRGLRL